MRTVFKKSHLPFLKSTLHGGSGRDSWGLARHMQDKNGLCHQLPAELALFTRGAALGDVWSMCELARYYFNYGGDLFLPQALSLWRRAALRKDPGTCWDLANLPIYDRILAFCDPTGNDYAAIEMKCAMLTEWELSGLGLSPFEEQTAAEREARVRRLIRACCPILGIAEVAVAFVPGLPYNGGMADGLAHSDGRIDIRAELLFDHERLVEVIFHELGHIILFAILAGGEAGATLKTIYGITDERMHSWQEGAMGYEVPTSEEDPDTLSYGVYTLWATFFLPRGRESI